MLELPLIDQGGVIGLAVVFDRQAREFAHVDLLRGLGQIAAQAIGNARVHRDLDAARSASRPSTRPASNWPRLSICGRS